MNWLHYCTTTNRQCIILYLFCNCRLAIKVAKKDADVLSTVETILMNLLRLNMTGKNTGFQHSCKQYLSGVETRDTSQLYFVPIVVAEKKKVEEKKKAEVLDPTGAPAEVGEKKKAEVLEPTGASAEVGEKKKAEVLEPTGAPAKVKRKQDEITRTAEKEESDSSTKRKKAKVVIELGIIGACECSATMHCGRASQRCPCANNKSKCTDKCAHCCDGKCKNQPM